MARESWYINESEMDDYQIPIVQRNMESSFIVKGCAGSDKTVLALWKAKEIDTAELGSYLVIVYTKALRQFIDDGVREIGLSDEHVMHHYQWKSKKKPKADFIIIDEVQDFSKEELLELQQSANKVFLLFGDSAQQIYKGLKKDLLTMEQIAFTTNLSMSELVLNHRLPKKIAKVAEFINTTKDALESRCQKEGASKPFLVKISSWESQLDFIMDIIEEKGYTDVALLFPDNRAVKSADAYLTEKGARIESKYDIDWYAGDVKFNLDFHSENPKLMTYHSSKGLQFEAVFIPDCSMLSLPGENVNPLYVATTRTYQDLFILYGTELTPYLNGIPKSHFEFIDKTAKSEDDLPF